MFIIKDWASNCLQYNGKFNRSSYGANTGSPMSFDSFDDAWDYILENFDDETHQDLYVDEV